ncbi:hypothetical protein [Aquimarina sp. I32.4]|uniref:hypothetical protein n=1 Tax=Aquimarina sp. I32.4 TaxID=2053903 RepID=UPI000CDEAF78|nr:hypothetical protein [Aquimarina sp. I32.4]
MVDFTRPITHTRYKYEKKLKKYYHRVEKRIIQKANGFNKLSKEEEEKYMYITDDYIMFHTKGTILPFWGGGLSLFMIVSGLFSDDTFDGFHLYVYIFFCVLLVFFTIYYFTKPKKERILNRKDGLITMTGFYWQNNITMPFKECLFAYSTGGEDGTSAFKLQIIRPTQSRLNSFDDFALGGDCYEDMSFICWYMDKNRPLPLGTAFDAYRDRDYERRKAAGFPRPLYPSSIATPEATKEQQAERKRIGGW